MMWAKAIQAKRRGRAVIVSHQTPPFRPAGLHTDLTHLHDQLHAYLAQDEGAVKDTLAADILARSKSMHVFEDMGWTEARARKEFIVYLDALHTHLHDLGGTLQPYGLHTFGHSQDEGLRLFTTMAMLGKDWLKRVFPKPEELFAVDFAQLTKTAPYAMVHRYVIENASLDTLSDPKQREDMPRAATVCEPRRQPETEALLTALSGRCVNRHGWRSRTQSRCAAHRPQSLRLRSFESAEPRSVEGRTGRCRSDDRRLAQASWPVAEEAGVFAVECGDHAPSGHARSAGDGRARHSSEMG
jgi:cobalamin biosynthesis Mg chelatase CobN